MYEELLGEKEVHKEAVFPKIFIGKAVLEQEYEVHYLIEKFDRMSAGEISEFVLNLANKRKNNVLLMAE